MPDNKHKELKKDWVNIYREQHPSVDFSKSPSTGSVPESNLWHWITTNLDPKDECGEREVIERVVNDFAYEYMHFDEGSVDDYLTKQYLSDYWCGICNRPSTTLNGDSICGDCL